MFLGSGLSGFIGSYLTKQLDVTPIPHEQLDSIELKPHDTFYFLSSYGNLHSQTDEYETIKANVLDLVHVLSQMKFKQFVYLSSSSVKLRTQTTYSRSKKAAEEILLAVMEKHNLPITIIRPFSVTGVGEQPEHLIPTLIRASKTGEVVNFVPNAVHDYISVEDVVSGIINLTGHKGIFELGTGNGHTNQQVLEIVEKLTGKKINVNVVDSMRPYDNEDWVSTNFKARGFGWLPRKSLEQSIKEML